MIRFLLTAVILFLLSGVVACRTMEETTQHLIEALSQSRFEDWSSVFLSTNSPLYGPVLPSTLFVPSSSSDFYDGKSKRRAAAYHIIPEKLDFFKLCRKTNGSRLHTLLGGQYLTLSNVSSGLTLNGVKVTEADVFVDAVVAIHRVASALDVAMYGGGSGNESTSLGWKLWVLMVSVLCILCLSLGRRCFLFLVNR